MMLVADITGLDQFTAWSSGLNRRMIVCSIQTELLVMVK